MLSSWKTDAGDTSSTNQSENKTATTTKIGGVQPKSAMTGRPQNATQSIVDESLTMRGDLESDANILVKGKVIGNVKCKVLIVDRGAQIEGGIEAEEVVVRGKIKGEIKAGRVHLENTADVEADIYQNTFLAEEGARILGALKSKDDKKGSSNMKVSVKKDKGSHNASL